MISVLCFHIVKHTSFISPLILPQDQKIAKKKQSKLPLCRDPIVTRSHARKMSTSDTSPYEENALEIALLKEKMAKMMRMMQQLVVGGGKNSSGHSQGRPQTENENQPPQIQNQGNNVHCPKAMTKTDPSKDKNFESGYGQIKSQVETLVKKLHIMEGSALMEVLI